MIDMPKVELHLHLEGAAEPAFIRGVAAEKQVDLSMIFDESGAYMYRGFEGFLRVYEAATSVLTTPEDYARLTRHVLDALADQGVIYAETFLSPDFCGGGDVAAWKDYLSAIEEAATKVAGQGGPVLRGIVTCIRHFGPDKAKAPATCAAETAGRFLCGFGMAGAETVGRPQDYAWAFDCAREAELGLTCHAGEWRGPESVRDALALGVTRLGHGVRSVEDLALVDDLAERGVVLEVCPGSNVALGIYPDWAKHPIAELRRRGVPVTISTDDPPFFHTTLEKEYTRLAEAFGFDRSELGTFNRIAADAAFCDPDTRAAIVQTLSAFYD